MGADFQEEFNQKLFRQPANRINTVCLYCNKSANRNRTQVSLLSNRLYFNNHILECKWKQTEKQTKRKWKKSNNFLKAKFHWNYNSIRIHYFHFPIALIMKVKVCYHSKEYLILVFFDCFVLALILNFFVTHIFWLIFFWDISMFF